jgi:DNA-binding MarR family transcriptional regulator
MNREHLNNMTERDLVVLEEIARNPEVSQRALATRMGVALGLANAIVKRIARRGFIKVRRFKANRLGYYITPRGVSEKASLVVNRIRDTVEFYREARGKAVEKVMELKRNGVNRVALCGTGELAEIVYLALKECEVEAVCVVAEEPSQGRWLGLCVVNSAEMPDQKGIDALIVTAPEMLRAAQRMKANGQRRLIDAAEWF